MRVTLFVSMLILSIFVYTQCIDTDLNLNYQNPCFEKDIVLLLRRDCAKCHEGGEYNFKIEGKTSDYEILKSYVNTDAPKESLVLKYAIGEDKGGKRHPQIWKEDSKEYVTFLNWVAKGAKKECLDDSVGECQQDSDCQEITCVCPDLKVVTTQSCIVDNAGFGICANDNNCVEDRFGICVSLDAGIGDSFINDTHYSEDISSVDSIADAYLYDTGYDVYALDAGYDTNYDSGIKDVGSSDIGYDVQQDIGQDAGVSTVSFSKQIVPLIKTDCRSCHYAGQHGIKLTGTTSDYSEVIRYVDVNNPEASYGFLWWASGGGGHPNKWPKGGTKYNLFLEWVQEGANYN